MTEISKCLNEWNATIEALGQGKQTILIRKQGTTLKEFLLYPTISYANKDDVLDSFQDDYKSFVKDNLLPKGENRTYEIKYYATVEEVIDDNNTIILNSTNYNKDNSIKEPVTVVDEVTDSNALDTTNSSEETETTEDKIVDIDKKIESKKYNKKNKYKNRLNQDNTSGENA